MNRLCRAFLLVLGLLGSLPVLCGNAHVPTLVIVVSQEHNIAALNRTELRKTFLGLQAEHAGVRLLPVINTTDPVLYEAFLQKVMFMSRRAYERQVVSLSFRTGSERPEVVDNPAELRDQLRNHAVISFMWSSDVQQHPGAVVVQSLSGERP